MNRALTVYLIIFAVFCIGIWTILSLGSAYLVAPRDLAGTWQCEGAEILPGEDSFTIHQSGKYFKLDIGKSRPLDLILKQTPSKSSPDEALTLQGTGMEIIATVLADPDSVQFEFRPLKADSGPSGTFICLRTEHPSAKLAGPASSPSQPSNHAR